MPHSLCIVIAGSGIGGLAAAYALARVGHAVTVLEQAPVLAKLARVLGWAQYGQPVVPERHSVLWRCRPEMDVQRH
jgi:2-polyprenyl-6-methoxyphenol hydroxylase-like FAD-dependent oxidoreductase